MNKQKKQILALDDKNVVLNVEKLTKIFAGKKPFTAVDHITFNLKEGEILGLLGPNGAGKTTTIQMLLSVLTPTSGQINYFGQDFKTHRSEALQQIAFASAYINLPWRLTVWENLDVYGRLYCLSKSQRQQRIKKLLTQFNAWQLKDKSIGSLSAGQKTRVMLAKAFLSYPKIVLLDEPTASLDPDVADEVISYIQKQRMEYNVSILFTSHNMAEVAEVCDRVMFLEKGKIVACDTPEQLAKSVSTAHVQLLVGDGLKRTIEYAQEQKLGYKLDNRSIEVSVDEQKIAAFLSGLAQKGVEYSQISIQKPTLEDYFLQLARKS
jgi:ABC-2 type transport system ATP-binding protein